MVKGAVVDDIFNRFEVLTQESSFVMSGRVRKEDRAPGGYELDVRAIECLHVAKEYPITPKEHGVDFLMDRRHLWLRSSRQHAILRVRHEVVKAIREFFDGRGFVLLDAPIFTPAACEGTSTLFETTISTSAKPISRSPVSSMLKPARWLLEKCMYSARLSAPRSQKHVVISRSSGWWSRGGVQRFE